jgi:biotin-(acetyl-CoA carboxylase) ligase
MLELAHQGAQVMQTRAVELGWVNDVVIEVLSSFEDAPGTLIKEDPLVEQRNKVRGLAHDRNVAKVTLVEVPTSRASPPRSSPARRRGHQRRHDRPEHRPRRRDGPELHDPQVELAKAKRILEPVARELGFREMTTDSSSPRSRSSGPASRTRPGYAARMFAALADRGREHRDDLDLGDPDHDDHRGGRARDGPAGAPRGVRARAPRGDRGGRRRVTASLAQPFIARRERFTVVGSTNDVVRGWLAAGEPEVCLAVADEQSAGRGREGRTWTAPPGRALLLSLGFRPAWLEPSHVWQIAACVGLAMTEAAESIAGLDRRSLRLKWPNDIVAEADDGDGPQARRRPGRDDGLGTAGPIAIVGIGVNVDWAAPTSRRTRRDDDLAARARGRPVDRRSLLDAFLDRLDVGSAPSGWAASTRSAGPAASSPTAGSSGSRIGRRRRGRPGRPRRPDDRRAGRRGSDGEGGQRQVTRARSSTSASSRGGVTDGRSGVWKVEAAEEDAPRSATSTGTARSSMPRAATRPSSTPCIAGISPRCTATRTTSSVTITKPRTPPSARSSPPSRRCRGSRSGPDRPTARAPRHSGSGSSRSPGTRSRTNAGRGAAIRQRRSTLAALVADPLDVEGGAATRDEAAAAWRAVGRLPADRRQALILRFVDEMSTAEIAGVLGKSEGRSASSSTGAPAGRPRPRSRRRRERR